MKGRALMAAPSADAIARELSGGTDATWRDFAARMKRETEAVEPKESDDVLVNGKFLGHAIDGGVSLLVRRRLRKAELSLSREQWDAIAPKILTIGGIRPKRGSPDVPDRGHGWGDSFDINADRCPYLIGEGPEAELDAELRPVYNRIAELILGRKSVIPRLRERQTTQPEAVRALWHELEAESDAFKRYFSLLNNRNNMPTVVNWVRANSPQASLPPEGLSYEELLKQYLILAQQPKLIDLKTGNERKLAPKPTKQGDRPFAHSDPRDGFLDALPEELVVALVKAGLDWGACAMGSQSGDLMHFQYVGPGSNKVKILEITRRLAQQEPVPDRPLNEPTEALAQILETGQAALGSNLAALAGSAPGVAEALDTLAALLTAVKAAGQADDALVDRALAGVRAVRPA